MVEVERDGERLALELTPQSRSAPDRGSYWALGVVPATSEAPAYDASLRFGPLAAPPPPLTETRQQARE